MTIRRIENPVPMEFPAAQLYLEDLEEIVGIFRDAVGGDQKSVPTVELKIGKEICDKVEELPKIAKTTTDFDIEVSALHGTASLWVSTSRTLWFTSSLTKEQAWAAFRKLEALFEKRKLRWTSLLHSSFWFTIIYGAASYLLFVLLAYLILGLLYGHAERALISGYRVLIGVVVAVVTILVVALRAGITHHSVIILRNSWDHAAAREELRAKIVAGVIPALIGALFGIGGALLAVYLRHKYWP